MDEFLYNGPDTILKAAIAAPIIYVAVVLFVRLSGKRTTTQMNNFDWIVAVAMGSLVASGLVADKVTVADALFAIFMLIALQYLFTLAAINFRPVERLIKAEPRLLLHRGRMLQDAMRKERVTEEEVLAAVRDSGFHRLQDVEWLILETDASFSVIARPSNDERATALANVPRSMA